MSCLPCSRYSAIVTLCWALFALSACGERQPPPPAGPELVLADSRGPMDGNVLVVGRDLRVGLTNASPGRTYAFQIHDETGGVVAQALGSADEKGSLDPIEVWNRTGVAGCGEAPLTPGGLYFANVAEAGASLDGRSFKLTVVPADGGATGGSVTDLSVLLELKEPSEAIYYWSDAEGTAQCVFDTDEPIYLSVFKGETETWSEDSRVFMFVAPLDKDDWKVGLPFEEVRLQPDCDGGQDVCGYGEGTVEPLPQVSTVQLQGVSPKAGGGFLAIIRPASYGSKEPVRLECDRVTESVMYIKDVPVDVDDTDDGWGCPPCPP